MTAPLTSPTDPPRRRGRPRGVGPADGSAIQAVDRSVDVLTALADEPGGLTLTALAARLGQSTSTLHRVLVTLERRRLVELDPVAQDWHIGAEAFRIGSAFVRRSGLVERARPVLESLMAETGETANLGVARGRSVLFLAQAETPEILRAYIPPGSLAPLHASGIGKALLAHRRPDELQALAAGGFEGFTARSLTTLPHLVSALDDVRAQGFAVDDEERTRGMRCIAAPIFDLTGQAVAGISVSGPLSRITDERLDTLAHCVKRHAAKLSRTLGG